MALPDYVLGGGSTMKVLQIVTQAGGTWNINLLLATRAGFW
jgi:hypothetical protein